MAKKSRPPKRKTKHVHGTKFCWVAGTGWVQASPDDRPVGPRPPDPDRLARGFDQVSKGRNAYDNATPEHRIIRDDEELAAAVERPANLQPEPTPIYTEGELLEKVATAVAVAVAATQDKAMEQQAVAIDSAILDNWMAEQQFLQHINRGKSTKGAVAGILTAATADVLFRTIQRIRLLEAALQGKVA